MCGKQRFRNFSDCCSKNPARTCQSILANSLHEGDMTTFDKREEGFEKKFAHDEELRFKANARRNRLLGLWAAERLGLSGPTADTYSKEVVAADFEVPADDNVFRKVRKDFDAKKVALSDQDLRKAMSDLMQEAVNQIKAGA
jgi:hypothetical protein